jgi:hypothetical protein
MYSATNSLTVPRRRRSSFLTLPSLDELLETSHAFELPVASEEVFFDIAHHAFVLAVGAGAPRSAITQAEAIGL